MNEWKEAFWLTKFELQKTNAKWMMLIIILSMPLVLLISHILTSSYFNDQFIGLDFLFLFLFLFLTKNLIPRVNDAKPVQGHGTLSNYLTALNSLPINKAIIVKNRLLTSLFISVPIQIMLLTSLYLTSSALREAMGIGSFVVFSIIWLSLSVYIGSANVTIQAGYRITDALFYLVVFFAVIFIITIMELIPTMQFESDLTFPPTNDQSLFSIEFGDPKGIIYWTMYLAKNHPIISTLSSILLSIIGFKYWHTRMLKRMKRFDYL